MKKATIPPLPRNVAESVGKVNNTDQRYTLDEILPKLYTNVEISHASLHKIISDNLWGDSSLDAEMQKTVLCVKEKMRQRQIL